MKHKKISILAALIIIIAAYLLFALSGRNKILPVKEQNNIELYTIGIDSGKHKIIGIQPYMENRDYQSCENFHGKLDQYFKYLKSIHLLDSNTVVLLPEYIGTWLVVAGEKISAITAPTIESAMSIIVLSNLGKFITHLPACKSDDKMAEAIFRMKAKKMAAIYEKTFKQLAKDYNVTIIAGSIILPEPKIENNRIVFDKKAPLQNVSFIFKPNGQIDNYITRKIYPTKDEKFLKPASLHDLPVYKTPVGKTGVLICADSWYPEPYQQLCQHDAQVVLVPSYSAPTGLWQQKWKGYSGKFMAPDIDTTDINRITEFQAWVKYAMLGRIEYFNFKAGMNVFLRGKLWDLGSDGRTFAYLNGKDYILPKKNAPIITVLKF